MTLSSITELDEATQFERFAIEAGLAQVRPAGHNAPNVIDIRDSGTTGIRANFFESMSESATNDLRATLRPLVLGAALKTIDLIVEFALNNDSSVVPKPLRWTFVAKYAQAHALKGTCLPLSADQALWGTVLALYVATEDLRHSLVHRRAQVDSVTGAVTPSDKTGNPLSPWSVDQQDAVCRVAFHCADAAIAGTLSARMLDYVRSQLDVVAGHHQCAPFGVAPSGQLVILIVRATADTAGWHIDIADALARRFAICQQAGPTDVRFAAPDGSGRFFGGPVEHLGPGPHVLDPAALPPWCSQHSTLFP